MTHFLVRGLAGALVIGAVIAAPALGEDPVPVAGNPACSDIDGTETWQEVKLDNEPGPGTVALPPGDLSGSVTIDQAREYFDFTVSPGVDAVIVKAGNSANVYYYDPDATHRTGLHGPINPSTGRPHQISHISFCYDGGSPPPPSDASDVCIDVETQVSPTEAHEGDTLDYDMTTVNCGDEPLEVDFSTTECDSGTLTGPSGDDGDGLLEVGETWTWECTHIVTPDDASDGSVTNTATALGTADDGRADEDSDSATATITPESSTPGGNNNPPGGDDDPPGGNDDPPGNNNSNNGGSDPSSTSGTANPGTTTAPAGATSPATTGGQLEVLPTSATSGASRLRGPSRCVNGRFSIRITGRRIASVRVRIDGRRVRTFRSASGTATRFRHRINGARFGPGIHRVVVRVRYAASAQTPARTHRLAFQRCGRQSVLPHFTG